MTPPGVACRECNGQGGWYPIEGEGRTSLGFPYPIHGPWRDCPECEAGRLIEDDDEPKGDHISCIAES